MRPDRYLRAPKAHAAAPKPHPVCARAPLPAPPAAVKSSPPSP